MPGEEAALVLVRVARRDAEGDRCVDRSRLMPLQKATQAFAGECRLTGEVTVLWPQVGSHGRGEPG